MAFDLFFDDKTPLAEKILAERQARVSRFAGTDKELARSYVTSPELITAVNVALSVGRPLLLTGEPGSGKTSAALWLASRLGLWTGEKDENSKTHYHKFQVRSDSRARDLCYDFDAVAWFREGQHTEVSDKTKYVSWKALGIAFGAKGEDGRPHLVLIDEIDKAPRDFPNDLLEELDRMQFTVLDTGQIVGPPKVRPIIVITSNAERRLPEPFLRRCVTHNIEITQALALQILERRLRSYQGEDKPRASDADLIGAGAQFWSGLSDIEGLSRKPTIAEFWQWLVLASEYPEPGQPDLVKTLLVGKGDGVAELPRIRTLFLPRDLDAIVRR